MTFQFKPKVPHPHLLIELQAALPNLPESDKGFALSLCDGHNKYGGWSDKQAIWAQKMVDKAAGAAANPLSAAGVAALAAVANLPPVLDNGPAPVASAGEMAAIKALFVTASAHLKKPSIKINFNNLKLALKPSAKNPENVLVVSDTGYPNMYYGTIFSDGTFKPKPSLSGDIFISKVTDALKAFAVDPAGVAAQYCKLHGKCCFGNKGLNDPKSTSVGYGPICAGHYGLPWGDNVSSGAAALKALAKKVTTGHAPHISHFAHDPSKEPAPVSPFSPPKGALHDDLKKVAAEAKGASGEKVAPVLSPEEYARMKARVEVLF
jgi:Family of unknown function (DUF6011)